MSHDDFKFEPMKGLPEHLPDGEHIVWQGGPRWFALARHVFHIRFVAAYFVVIALWRLAVGLQTGVPAGQLTVSALWPLGLGAIAIGVLSLIAWGYGRTTVYTITNKRTVIRSGVAFQVTYNIPFKVLTGVGLREHKDGTGDLPLELDGSAHIAYLHMWPNTRPWYVTRVQPMLRNVPDAATVGERLTDALVRYQSENQSDQAVPAQAGTTVEPYRKPTDKYLPGTPAMVAAE